MAVLPHQAVWARLGVSPLHGIGVFAIRPIPAGTDIFASDSVDLVWVDRAELEASDPSPEQRAFYRDFAIVDGDRLGCPKDFNHLTPGWYLNQPAAGEQPNLTSDPGLSFTALRDIAAGEELTIFYSDFNRPD